MCDGLAAQHHFIEDTGLTVWPDGTSSGSYRFQHALYQQVLYEQVGTVRRVRSSTGVLAHGWRRAYGARAGDIAAQLAVHFERGGEIQRAVAYWQQVGDNAARRNAHPEAIAALRKGLALLATLPESPERTRRELALQLILGELLMAAKGMASPEAGEAYSRAYTLCQQVEETPQRFRVLWGLFVFHNGPRRGCAPAQRSASSSSTWRNASPIRSWCERAIWSWGWSRSISGDLVAARTHLEQSLELSAGPAVLPPSSPAGYHPRITSLCAGLLRPLWELGYADQAQQRCQEALALARQLGAYPQPGVMRHSLPPCSPSSAGTWRPRRHTPTPLMALADAQGFALRLEQGRMLRGWALAMQGDAARGGAHPSGVGSVSRRGTRDPAPPLAGLTGGGLWPGGAARGRPDGARRGLDAGGDNGGALVGGRVVSSQGGIAAPTPEPRGPPGGSLFPAGTRGGPPPAGQGIGTPRRAEPQSALAAVKGSMKKPDSC